MHYNAYLANCRFLCYDVICNYWPFAITVANKLPQFNDMVTKMEKFQSSFHGFTHTRGCQVCTAFYIEIFIVYKIDIPS